jgi:hypothetical protein
MDEKRGATNLIVKALATGTAAISIAVALLVASSTQATTTLPSSAAATVSDCRWWDI